MEKRLTALLLGLILSLGITLAQTKITGTVVSQEDGEPVIGASVLINGTKNVGTTTNYDGKFTITVPQGKKLKISYIGMNDAIVTPKNGMVVKLTSNATLVDEVVVTGMQKMDKRLFAGATAKVDASKAKLDGVADISRSLEGRAAGVSVQNVSGTFGTAPKIRVRGATSIYGSSKPLWVVDGVIMEDVVEVSADQLSSGDAETLISSAIAGLNTDDIESFQILKDGSATSIYGARAMAGVIVVNTKRGKAGTSRINYTGEFTMRLKPSYSQYNIMNSQEQMSVYREMQNNGFLSFQGSYRASDSGVFGKMYHLMNEYDPATGDFKLANTKEAMYRYLQDAEYRNTDWFDELFSNAISMNHSIGMSSGTEKAQYYTSFSVMNDPGQTKLRSSVQRYTANMNANYNLSKKLSLNVIGNAAYRKQEGIGSDNQGVDVVSGAVTRDFDINPYSYALRTSRTMDPDEYYIRNYAPFNIKHELEENYIEVDAVDAKFQAELKYKPVQTVELGLLGAYKYSEATTTRKITEYSNLAQAFRMMDDATMRDNNPWLYTDPDNVNSLPITVLPNGGFYREAKNKMNYWDVRFSANYNDVFNDIHTLNLLGAIEVDNTDRVATSFNGVGMQYDLGMLGSYDYRYFKQASEDNSIYYSVGNNYTRSAKFFINANYMFKGRYSVNATLHYEGSNRMGRSNSARWLPTWNISPAWNISEEPFFQKFMEKTNGAVSYAKLRASYSLTGDKPAVTNAMVIIRSNNPWRPFTQDKESTLEIAQFANPDLTYEKKHEFNLGVDLGFLNNRINFQFDWYTRTNFDLIGPKRTTGVGGTIVNYANVAEMKSHGEEFTLSTRNIDKPDFKWNTDIIFSHTHCEVTKLDARNRIIDLLTGSGFTTEGYPYRSLFSIDFRGLNSNGLPTFINEEGELTTSDLDFQSYNTDYLIYEGSTDPTITGSVGNTFTFWNKLHLNLFVTYSFGNVVRLDPAFSSSYSDMSAMPKEFMNRWVVAGDENTTTIPAIADLRQIQSDSYLNRAYNAYNYSHERIAKGDFIRMKEISVSYDFPEKWVRALHLSNLNMKLQATNLFLIYADKKLNGQDPEFVNAGGTALPMQRQFTYTLRIGI
jgi:TonB-linked SusC/RagA family outer membrane protein